MFSKKGRGDENDTYLVMQLRIPLHPLFLLNGVDLIPFSPFPLENSVSARQGQASVPSLSAGDLAQSTSPPTLPRRNRVHRTLKRRCGVQGTLFQVESVEAVETRRCRYRFLEKTACEWCRASLVLAVRTGKGERGGEGEKKGKRREKKVSLMRCGRER
jgi:hypothetical protein